MNHWLMKSEPDAYSIDDLATAPQQIGRWDGVRNYQARNMLRDGMKRGDLAFFYHSSCETPGIAGMMEIVREGYPDFTAFDPNSEHYDPKSSPKKPQWFMVDVRLVKKLKRVITLQELKQNQKLADMILLRKGNRLSIMPVTATQWKIILTME